MELLLCFEYLKYLHYYKCDTFHRYGISLAIFYLFHHIDISVSPTMFHENETFRPILAILVWYLRHSMVPIDTVTKTLGQGQNKIFRCVGLFQPATQITLHLNLIKYVIIDTLSDILLVCVCLCPQTPLIKIISCLLELAKNNITCTISHNNIINLKHIIRIRNI